MKWHPFRRRRIKVGGIRNVSIHSYCNIRNATRDIPLIHMYTLTVVFDKDHNKVLMCKHSKQHMMNFIGGKIRDIEDPMHASYRELQEETGITKDDIDLKFVRCEQVTTAIRHGASCVWTIYVTTGVLNKDVELIPEKNRLKWISLKDFHNLLPSTFGNGNCLLFLNESADVLGFDSSVYDTSV